MERSINPELLGLALGNHQKLPSAEKLSKLLADAELALLMHEPKVPDELIAMGWYLHGVASSKFALREYGVKRQRAAFQISGHIFDLQLQSQDISEFDKCKYCFAAQIANARSSLTPNSIALYKREFPNEFREFLIIRDFQLLALSCGIAFLGFDTKYVNQKASEIIKEVKLLEDNWNVEKIDFTLFGAAANVVRGSRNLMKFLMNGKLEFLEYARENFYRSIHSEASFEDDISRWIAAHLLSYSNDLEQSSIWNVLPPNVPKNVRFAFVNGKPRVLTLWPPQIDFLNSKEEITPLSKNVKRLILSSPTSGGKTLLAQLLVTTHLSINSSSVCYVASTRSLCREVKHTIQSRLRFIDKQIIDGLPEGDWLDSILEDLHTEVEVMTPERLSYLIRTDSEKVLNRFGMFIFDEVHLVGDKGRGWTLEEDLSFLHYATENTHHKIILISAVIGNRNHFVQWLERDNKKMQPYEFHSDWRGPRKIHAIWTTEASWKDKLREKNPRAKRYTYLETTPLYGRLDVRISHTGDVQRLRTKEPIGTLIRKSESENKGYQKVNEKSTSFYSMLVPIIDYLAAFGPVLIIEATKPAAIRLAKAIAETRDYVNNNQLNSLVDLVIARLGESHPLRHVLEKGVAYHHGSLPSEIRIALEEAVSEGYIKYIVATTTLTEGINIPVTSVLIASLGSYGEEGYTEFIVGPKLINAIGRAGRSTKETEGIVVLALHAEPNPTDFDRLNPDKNDLQITSMLAREEALEDLARFEDLLRDSEDAVFEVSGSSISDFLKFVWFLASELERINKAVEIQEIQKVLSHTLGWVQLDPQNKIRWLKVADTALKQYQLADKNIRRRWASSSLSISSSKLLEQIVQEIISEIQKGENPQGVIETIEFIIDKNRFDRILQLPEAPRNIFYTNRGKNRHEILVPSEKLLIDWIKGMSQIEISETYLFDINDVEYRFEQLGEYVYSRFEVYLPWVFGTIITWVNDVLLQNGFSTKLSKNIPANIRYGVENETSLKLMIYGIQSRSLANKISEIYNKLNKQEENVLSWIRSLSLSQWVDLFDASTNEIKNLLNVVRINENSVSSKLFSEGKVEFDVMSNEKKYPLTSVALNKIEDSDISEIGIWDKDRLLGRILCKDQVDIHNLLDTGLPLEIQFFSSLGKGVLKLKLLEFE